MYGLAHISTYTENEKSLHTGWLPPLPDLRDYGEQHPKIEKCMHKLCLSQRDEQILPAKVDLRSWCSPVEDQGALGSCTAHAAAGVIEYFERRAYGKYAKASRLFIYKTTRNLMGVTGDTGAWLRTTMGAVALCGAAGEAYWPYTDSAPGFDVEPPAFVYSIAKEFGALQYFCHDPLTSVRPVISVLNSVKKYLAAGIPAMFGFYGFPSFNQADVAGGIPFPCRGEGPQWGHAVTAVGYDDHMKIKNRTCNEETTGALLIRNSWGQMWGENGYGWLPYDFVLRKLALDFWSLVSMHWIDTDQFGLF